LSSPKKPGPYELFNDVTGAVREEWARGYGYRVKFEQPTNMHTLRVIGLLKEVTYPQYDQKFKFIARDERGNLIKEGTVKSPSQGANNGYKLYTLNQTFTAYGVVTLDIIAYFPDLTVGEIEVFGLDKNNLPQAPVQTTFNPGF
jgi:hypothetical protein